MLAQVIASLYTMTLQIMGNSKFALFLVAVVISTACQSPRQELVDPDTPWLSPEAKLEIVGEFSIGSAGAKSSKFAKDKKYQDIEITLITGKEPALYWKWNKHFVIGADSEQGVIIQQLLEKYHPWDWQTTALPAFADNLNFNGNIGERKWDYMSAYPDKSIEEFLIALRKSFHI
jgi:hypothetical protein